VQTDYAQAELRVLSYLAGDKYFRDIFNAGDIDLFDDLTPQLFPHEIKPGPEIPISDIRYTHWKDIRVRVKAFVYGLAYGRTAEGIAMEYDDMSLLEAREARDNFFKVIPEIADYLQSIRVEVRKGNNLVTPFGRHRRFYLLTKENIKDVFNEAQAFMPQSTASDICLSAMIKVRQDLKGIGWVRNIVHDSLLVECHEDDAQEVKTIVEGRMIESFDAIIGGYVKCKVDSDIGRNWGEV
jgi:DNA polymerase-1